MKKIFLILGVILTLSNISFGQVQENHFELVPLVPELALFNKVPFKPAALHSLSILSGLVTPINAESNEAFITDDPREEGYGVEIGEARQVDKENMICVETPINEKVLNAEHYMLQDNSRYYLGAIVDGTQLAQGIYEFVDGDRKPVSFSIDIENINGRPDKTMNDVSRSAYTVARRELLRQGIEGTPSTKASYTEDFIYSKEQFHMKLGGYFDNRVNNVAADFNIDWRQERTRMLVSYHQVFYTLSTDDMNENDFFKNDVVPDEDDLYVASIAYGRTLLFLFESEEDETVLKSAIKYAYDDLINKAGGNINVTYQSIIKNASVKIYIQGGNGNTSSRAITDGFEGIKTFIEEGDVYHPTNNPGSPIYYTLRFCKNGRDAYAFTSTTYSRSFCNTKSKQFKVELDYIHNVDKEDEGNQGPSRMEPYGAIKVHAVVVDKNGNRHDNWITPVGFLFPSGFPQLKGIVFLKSKENKMSIKRRRKITIDGKCSFIFSNSPEISLDYSYLEVISRLKDWDQNWIPNSPDDPLFGKKRIYFKDFFNSNSKRFEMNLGDWRMKLGFKVSQQDVE